MAITVDDIRNKAFGRKVRGYNEIEVDEFLDRTADALKTAQDRSRELEGQLHATAEQLAYLKGLETTLRDTLLTAQRSADDTVATAQVRAQQLTASAQESVAAIQAEASGRIEAAQKQAEEIIAKAREEADRLLLEGQEKAEEQRSRCKAEKDAHEAFRQKACEMLSAHLADLRAGESV